MEFDKFTANWNYPTNIRQGIGRITELPSVCRKLGITAPLLVTDPGLSQMPMILNAVEACVNNGLNCKVFAEIVANPTQKNVTDGVIAYKEANHDGVIAFGGGSALDAGKAIALMVGQNRPLWDFEEGGSNASRVNVSGMAPVVAIPTTSGTGAEVGRTAVISDSEQQVKRLIFHPNILPDIVILDAQLTVGLPAPLTAATGMDALSHALEAYCAPTYHPMAEGIAIAAVGLIKSYLPRACSNGEDIEARAQVMVASTMGATAFQRGLGAMHALAHPLGAVYNCHHGLLNAILMPYVLQANSTAIEQKIAHLALCIGLDSPSFECFLAWVVGLKKELNIPHSLAEIGIDLAQVEQIADMAVKDPCAGGNPIQFSASQYSEILTAAVTGEL